MDSVSGASSPSVRHRGHNHQAENSPFERLTVPGQGRIYPAETHNMGYKSSVEKELSFGRTVLGIGESQQKLKSCGVTDGICNIIGVIYDCFQVHSKLDSLQE